MLAVLPHLGKAGMVLSRTELSPMSSSNFHYRTRSLLKILLVVYLGLTFLETILLMACGMTIFDAITHSFATIATGGFSTNNSSIAGYGSFSVELVVMVFMVLSGIHFGLLFTAVTGRSLRLLRSQVVRYYLLSLAFGILITAACIHGNVFNDWSTSLRHASFQIISLGTSTGFATTDSTLWPIFTQLFMLFFILQCACAGSTSGGIKCDRLVLCWQVLRKRIKIMQHPSAVVSVKVDGHVIDSDLVESGVFYVILYLVIVFISSLLLTALGVDGMTSFSACATTMGNVGPGFGLIGSMDNFSGIPEAGKWILTADMLLGRLEIFGLVLLATWKWWK